MSQPKWRVPQELLIKQGNGWGVGLRLTQNGTTLTGSARTHKTWKRKFLFTDIPEIRIRTGSADGTIVDNTFRVEVFWSENSVGVYQGTINPQGRIQGTTHDRDHPRALYSWHSTDVLTPAR